MILGRNFELNLYSVMVNIPFLAFVLGDFNAKLSLWYNNEITTHEGSKASSVTSQFGLKQIIKNTHTLLVTPRCELSYRIWGSFLATRKLSSLDNVCEIQS